MDDLSLIVLPRSLTETVDRFLPELSDWLAVHPEVDEVLFLEDGAHPAPPAALARLLDSVPKARVLALDPAWGASVSLGAALASVRATTVAVVEGTGRYPLAEIDRLRSRLARADAVFGCRRLGRLARLQRALLSPWRRWWQGVDIRDPGCLLWAARREAVEHVRLSPGSFTLLPRLIARRGFRVAQLHVDHRAEVPRFEADRAWWPRWRADRLPNYNLRQWSNPERRRAAA
jgi:dolichol-phosphate mannosyltransferase